MKYILLILSIFLTTATVGQTSNNLFHKDLDFVYQKLRRSASYRTQKSKHKIFEKKYRELKQETAHREPGLIEAYMKLFELADVLTDNHNLITGNTKSFSYKDLQDKDFLKKIKQDPAYNFYPKVKLDLDSLENVLSTKDMDDIEGVYYYYNTFKIAIFKNRNNLYQGVVLETKIPSWERGETMLYLKPKGNNRFRIFMGGLVNKKLMSSPDYFRDGTFMTIPWKRSNHKNKFYNAPYPGKKYLIRHLNHSFTYLKLGTFNSSPNGIKQATTFYNKICDALKTPSLIVDLRNNGGGGDKSSKQFFQLFKKYKGNIYLVTNYYTVSNAEQFTIKMKNLKNVTVLGDRTFGMVTYGRNYPEDFETPSKRFRIHFTDLKDHWRKYLHYENVGVEPDVYLDTHSDWVEQILERYGR